MSEFLTNPYLKRPYKWEADYDPKYPWVLEGDLKYYSDTLGAVLVVPHGFHTDFASIPVVFRRLFPQDGPWTHAAIVHDFLCVRKYADIDYHTAAKVFREAMEVLGVPAWRRNAMYRAVVWFGPKWP